MKFIFVLTPVLLFLVGTVAYLSPGASLMWQGSTTHVLSDGTDPAAFPQYFAHLIQLFRDSPLNLLYGAVHSPLLSAPEGLPQWIPWFERPLVLFLSVFLPVEQISTGYAFVGMLLNAVFMYAFARALAIPRTTSWGMGAAWAFCAYTHARAKVHMGLVGIYHLPLIFLALWWASRKELKAWPVLAFLMVSGVPHYYLVMLLPFVPLLGMFAWQVRTISESTKTWVVRTVIFGLPAVLLLVWSVAKPLPPSANEVTHAFPRTGVSAPGQSHPFMYQFAARPIDYFTGDIGLGVKDLNPLKQKLNQHVTDSRFGGANSHERAIGVRWLLWIIAAVALSFLVPSKKTFWGSDRNLVILFAIFGLGSFWLSLSPAFGASGLLHGLVSQFRVPGRAGIGVGFALIMMSGLFLKALSAQKPRWAKSLGLGFALLILIEFPPYLQPLPTTEILPVHTALLETPCGMGIRFPYVSGQSGMLHYYYFLQRMRGSLCPSVNAASPSVFDRLALHYLSRETDAPRLKKLVDCVPLKWVVFGPPLPVEEAKKLCAQWGWQWHDGGVCKSENVAPTPARPLLECLQP